MSEPLVCAVMLTKDRPEMAKRAVECFRKQTYNADKRWILVYDTGKATKLDFGDAQHLHVSDESANNLSIGELRNVANGLTCSHFPRPDIFVHFDDDDWSHSNRIAEQVALLQASGKQAVGYRDMLFWCDAWIFDEANAKNWPVDVHRNVGEAWLYSNDDPRYCLGTSLCYWRETWEKRPFKALNRGEDKEFLRERDTLGVSSFAGKYHGIIGDENFPRMIASFHGGNTSTPDPSRSTSFERVPEWDDHCRSKMAL